MPGALTFARWWPRTSGAPEVLDSSNPEEATVKILYLATSGSNEPTMASIPLHIAANGSVETGQQCAVALAGDATELILQDTADRIEGVGVPPARELLRKLLDNEVPVYV
jgi:predicted peroxiredoxin